MGGLKGSGLSLPASAAAALDAQAEQQAMMQAAMGGPTADEQRRIAALNFAVAIRGEQGWADSTKFLAAAKSIEHYIVNG